MSSEWIKVASGKKHRTVIDGKVVSLSQEQIAQRIKTILKSSKALLRAFRNFGIGIEKLDDLQIVIEPLDKQYALTDAKVMRINSSLFDGETDFFKDLLFVIFHEMLHFIKRTVEINGGIDGTIECENEKEKKQNKKGYLYDPEEGEAFCLAIAHYLSIGKSVQDVVREIYPRIEWHFHDKNDAMKYFRRLVSKAKKYL